MLNVLQGLLTYQGQGLLMYSYWSWLSRVGFFRGLKEDLNCNRQLGGDWLGCSGTGKAQACHELKTPGIPVSLSTVTQWVLHHHVLGGWHLKNKPLLQNQDLQAWLKFAAAHMHKPNAFWRKPLWSDDTKTELFGHNNKTYVWRSKREALKPKNIVPTVKDSGASKMLWSVAASGSDTKWYKVDGIMKNWKKDYLQIQHLKGWILDIFGGSSRTMIKRTFGMAFPQRWPPLTLLKFCGLWLKLESFLANQTN